MYVCVSVFWKCCSCFVKAIFVRSGTELLESTTGIFKNGWKLWPSACTFPWMLTAFTS